MKKITWTKEGYRFDGQPEPFISGEFHYFRVPKKDWRERLQRFKEAGGNAVATYIPWVVHEPQEGKIIFDDRPERDLTAFLTLCREMDIPVTVRPGPHVYSELQNNSLPGWLVRNYPEILACDARGNQLSPSSVSYLHPVFLEKARRFYRAAAQVLRPFTGENGGPICMVQLDNELGGIHIWRGSLDYQPEAMGFGKPDGRYTRWLRSKYRRIEALNIAYGKNYSVFSEVRPVDPEKVKDGYFGGKPSNIFEARRNRDYADFYYSIKAEYLGILRDWLREDGITDAVCHNPPGVKFIADFEQSVKKLGKDFLLGTDNYYNLGYQWAQNNPTPQYALRVLLSTDFLKELGQPPTTLEMQGGSLSDFPPVLPEDIEASYMASTGMGMKGLNYYIFTGGPNFEDTGATAKVYDFNAMISADNQIRPTYYAMANHSKVAHSHAWMQTVSRTANVTIGFTWEDQHWSEEQCGCFSAPGELFNAKECRDFLREGILLTMLGSGYLPELCEIGNGLPADRIAIIPCSQVMATEKQKKIISFLQSGGRAILGPVLPIMDENYKPCTLLADALGMGEVTLKENPSRNLKTSDGSIVYLVTKQFSAPCREGKAIAFHGESGEPVAYEIQVGKGKLIWLGADWRYKLISQRDFLISLLERLGGKEIIRISNPSIWAMLWQKDDKASVFVYNLFSGAQETDLSVFAKGKWHDCGHLQLPAMKVICIDLDI